MERLKLNLVPGGVLTVCHASQYDNGRTVRFDLYDGDSKVTLAGTETITATLRKPSGAEVTLNVTNTSSDYVDVVTDSDTCDEAGVYLGELTVVSGSVIIGSANFILLAELDPYGQAQLVVRSASGSIVNFNTSVVENLIECIADFAATQAEGTPSPSVPIPIVGVDKVNIVRTGKNMFDKSTVTTGKYFDSNGDIQNTTTSTISDYIKVNASTAYYFGQWYQSLVGRYVTWFDKNKNVISTDRPAYSGGALTSPNTAVYVRVTIGNDYVDSYQLEVGSTATPYEAYNGTTALINLGGTYYGGSVDAVTGKITLTHYGFILTGAGEESWSVSNTGTANYYYVISLPTGSASAVGGSNIANIFPSVNIGNNNTTQGCYNTASALRVRWGTEMTVADWKTWLGTNNLTVVYKLATPIDVYASNTAKIPTILGDNWVFCDTGDVAIKYYAKSTD